MKILRICHNEYLPSEENRTRDYIYFVFDRMQLYLGKNICSDPFCVVETMPDRPVEGMLYITLDGWVKSQINEVVYDVAYIEDPEELKYLSNIGTVYFLRADYRYLDLQTRTLILPFDNGSYQLSVRMAANLMIDENTIIRFNPKTNMFEIDGGVQSTDENITNTDGLVGVDTSTINTSIIGNAIKSELKVSSESGNLIRIMSNGIYASLDNAVKKQDLNALANTYADYRESINGYMEELQKALDDIKAESQDAIASKILSALEEYEPTIDVLLNNYKNVYDSYESLKDNAQTMVDTAFDSAVADIEVKLDNIVSPWGTFDEP